MFRVFCLGCLGCLFMGLRLLGHSRGGGGGVSRQMGRDTERRVLSQTWSLQYFSTRLVMAFPRNCALNDVSVSSVTMLW